MSKKSIQVIFNSIFSFVSLSLLSIYINSIAWTFHDNRLNIRVLVQLIRNLKMQLWILVICGAVYISILVLFGVFLDKIYPTDKHKDIQ
jgi:hypothetical protein